MDINNENEKTISKINGFHIRVPRYESDMNNIENGSTGSGFVWPMIWTTNKYTYYISIAFMKNDDINQFQRVENVNVRIFYIPY